MLEKASMALVGTAFVSLIILAVASVGFVYTWKQSEVDLYKNDGLDLFMLIESTIVGQGLEKNPVFIKPNTDMPNILIDMMRNNKNEKIGDLVADYDFCMNAADNIKSLAGERPLITDEYATKLYDDRMQSYYAKTQECNELQSKMLYLLYLDMRPRYENVAR